MQVREIVHNLTLVDRKPSNGLLLMLTQLFFILAPGAPTLLDKADEAVGPQNGTPGKPGPSDIID